MKVLILGYGYCGFYFAQAMAALGAEVITVNRQLHEAYSLDGAKHVEADFTEPLKFNQHFDVVAYLAPPPAEGIDDNRLRACLRQNSFSAGTMLYFGSSGVYGDHQGQWVDEESVCHIRYDRQRRRLDAEAVLSKYAKENKNHLIALRVAGIYGPGRLPLKTVQQRSPIITPKEAPISNLIYVNDLINASMKLLPLVKGSEIFNIADGEPRPMGSMAFMLNDILQLAPLEQISLATSLEKASPMKKEFLSSSKKLSIEKLKASVSDFQPTPLRQALIDSINI